MVAGAVAPPRLDLANEDLVRSHLQGIWVAEAGLRLGRAMSEVLDVPAPDEDGTVEPELALQPRSSGTPPSTRSPRTRTVAAAQRVLGPLLPQFAETTWWYDEWLQDQVRTVAARFDEAFGRWRRLYQDALKDYTIQGRRAHRLQQPHRRRAQTRHGTAARGVDTAQSADEQERGQQVRAVRLQPLPLPGLRGVPARLQLPAAAAGGVHPDDRAGAAATATTCSGPGSWPSASSGPARSSTTRAPATR